MRLGLNFLPSMKKPNSCQWPAASASGAVAEKVTVRRLVISDSLMVCSGGGGNLPGSFMSIGAPDTTTLARGADRRGVPRIVRCRVQGIGAGGARLHQQISALARSDQNLLERLHGPELNAVLGDGMQVMLLQLEWHA